MRELATVTKGILDHIVSEGQSTPLFLALCHWSETPHSCTASYVRGLCANYYWLDFHKHR